MQIDQKAIRRLLSMNDEQLTAFMTQIAQEAGIDPGSFGIQPGDIQSIRRVLGNATEQDIQKMNLAYAEYKQNKRRR